MVSNPRTDALAEARDLAEARGEFDVGMCLQQIRQLYDIPVGSPFAAAAWQTARFKHAETDFARIPPGVPVFWLGGSHGAGHIAMKAGPLLTHDVWSTDFLRRGHLDRVDGRLIAPKWGLRLVGWTEDLNGVRIYTPPPSPTTKPTPAPHPSEHRFVDYSFSRPNPAAIKEAGYRGAFRYLSAGGKGVTAAEAKALHDAGLWVGLVWETTAKRAGEGKTAGRTDAKKAEALADRLGVPRSVAIFYAVDFDATPANVRPYFEGVKAAASRPVGVYGSADIVDAGLAQWAWQTSAWSHGRVSSKANLLQRTTHAVTIKGSKAADWDENVTRHGVVPVWRHHVPKPAPAPKPKPGPTLNVVSWNLKRDRDPGTVRLEVESLAMQTKADVLAFQEANDYAAVLRKVPGYRTIAMNQSREQNGSILLVRDGLKVGATTAHKMTSHGWRTVKGGMTPPIWATAAVVEGIEFVSVHTPPSQQPTVKRRLMPRRASAYDELMGNLKPSAHYVVAADWNVTPDAKGPGTFPLPRFRALGLTLVAPRSGTLGRRTVDYFGVRGVNIGAATVVVGKRGSDHRPVQFTVQKES